MYFEASIQKQIVHTGIFEDITVELNLDLRKIFETCSEVDHETLFEVQQGCRIIQNQSTEWQKSSIYKELATARLQFLKKQKYRE